MRLARLHLDKYGHLTDVVLDLPAHTPDLHLVLGANEAGKSTTQAAIADFLFGFPHLTDYAYQHAAPDLRVGARIESPNGPTLEVWRRKGRSGTLLGPDGQPADEAALAALLRGVDRDAFQRQFSLSHDRLRAGGEAMLQAEGDLGRLLFQAGSGLDWLGERLETLAKKAEDLFKPRGQNQTVNAALKRRADALKRQREATVTERVYEEARRAVEDAQTARDRDAERYAALHGQRRRLERASHVIPVLRRLDAALEEHAGLADLPADLGSSVRETLTAAVRAVEEAGRTLARAKDDAARAREGLESLPLNEPLLARTDEITALLDTPRSRFLTAEEDLPKREGDRRAQEAAILERAVEVGVPDLTVKTVPDHRPTRARTVALRKLADRHGRLVQAAEDAGRRRDKGQRDLERARVERESLGAVPEMTALSAALEAATDDLSAGLEDRLTKAREAVTRLGDEMARRRGALVPPVPPGVSRVVLPATAVAEGAASRLHEAETRLQALRQARAGLDQDIADKERERRDLLDQGGAVPLEHLQAARDRRDTGWHLVRRRYVEGAAPDDAAEQAFAAGQPLADVLTEAMVAADRVADDRFATHEISAQLAVRDADLRALQDKREALNRDMADAEAARAREAAEWGAVWEATGITPLEPAAMVEWLTALEALEALAVDRDRAEAERAGAQRRVDRHTSALVAALEDLGGASGADDTDSLAGLARRALRVKADVEKRAQARVRAEDAVARLTEADEEARAAYDAALRALAAWRQDWAATLAAWGLPSDTVPEAIEPVLTAWETIGQAYDALTGPEGLDHRIETMRADQARFREGLAGLVAAVAPDLADVPPLSAAQALRDRLQAAETQRSRRRDAAERVAQSVDALRHATEDHSRAGEALAAVLLRLGADTVEAAGPLLDRLDRRAELERIIADSRAALTEAGDGNTEDEIRAEVAALTDDGADADSLEARLDTVAEDERHAFETVQALSETLAEQRAILDGYHRAGAAAAEAAEDAEQAVTTALRAAERYVRLQTTAVLLHHAVARYRAENEAPLLRRAGALFQALTQGRYDGLVVDRDTTAGASTLRARAADGGATVPVPGLSDGTRDQMFLALRLAGLEALLERGTRLPFIADDLFVHFDDARTAAGLRVLAQVATHTQVLVFTHHRHLVDLARATIPGQFAFLEIGD